MHRWKAWQKPYPIWQHSEHEYTNHKIRLNESYFTLLLKWMILLIEIVMYFVNISILLLDVVVLRSWNGFHLHESKWMDGFGKIKEKKGEKKSELPESNQRPLDCCEQPLQSNALPTELSSVWHSSFLYLFKIWDLQHSFHLKFYNKPY